MQRAGRAKKAGRLGCAGVVVASLWLGAGCWHGQRPLPPPGFAATARAQAKTWHNRVVALKHSHYYGELYDDNERVLLSPYAFATLYHRVDLAGRPITAGTAHGIVPAGTQVVIESVQFPGPLAFLRRMLNAPTSQVWVTLRLDDSQPHPAFAPAQSTGRPRPLVVVLEADVQTPQQLQTAMDELFGEPAPVRAWLAGLRPRVRVAVHHKQVLRGMRQHELLASQGEPWRWLMDEMASGETVKVAWYPQHEAWLVGDEVVEVRRARPQ